MKKSNIIYITIDALRFDHLGLAGYSKNTSPFIDSIAKSGVYFERAYALGPGSAISSVGAFTSTYSLDYGGYSYVDRPRILLSEILKQNGYTTYAFHSSPHLSGFYGHDRGWSKFCYLSNFKHGTSISESHVPGTRKARTIKKVSNWKRILKDKFLPAYIFLRIFERCLLFLRKFFKDITGYRPPAYYTARQFNEAVSNTISNTTPKPVFIWVHFMDVHAPFGSWARSGRSVIKKILFYINDYLTFLLNDVFFLNRFIEPLAVRIYDDSIKYLDENLKDLFSYLTEINILNNDAIVVIHADHGEEFLEHGSLGHPQKLFNENIQVPLIVMSSSRIKPKRISRPVSLVDVAPTILDLIGIPKPSIYVGKNLFDASYRPVIAQASDCEGDLSNPVYTGAMIIDKDFKLFHLKDKRYLFLLSDKNEKKNIYYERKDVVQELEKKLEPYTHPSWESLNL